MMDGPEGNPALAAKMLKQFEDVGLVLMRGQPNLADRLDIMREWAKVCMPHLVKYEGGANTRHGKIENVYEVGAPTVSNFKIHRSSPIFTLLLRMHSFTITTRWHTLMIQSNVSVSVPQMFSHQNQMTHSVVLHMFHAISELPTMS